MRFIRARAALWPLLGLCALLTTAGDAAARQPTTGIIAGRVLIRNGDELEPPRERVRMLLAGTNEINVVWTDEAGFFKAGGVRRGAWRIQVSHRGYRQTRRAAVQVASGAQSVPSPHPIILTRTAPAPPASAGAGDTLSGQLLVSVGNNYLLPGERVKIVAVGEKEPIIIWAAEDGTFSASGIPAGKWTLAVQHPHYRQAKAKPAQAGVPVVIVVTKR
jgi:hypothetical protein